jgi:MFS family permease
MKPARSLALRGWLLAVLVFFVASMNRSSLAVAGLHAQERFGITPTQLGTFLVLQLGIYAAMQVPTGLLVDRYGPKRLLVSAGLMMGLGQLLFALAPSYGAALLARTLLGCGDALTYVSVLRYSVTHFSAGRYSLIAGITATVGTVGSIFATLPLAVLLDELGWEPVYLAAAGTSVLVAHLVWGFLRDDTPTVQPLRTLAQVRSGLSNVAVSVRATWRSPGTRLGFWQHFSTPGVYFGYAMLWGSPYLQVSLGMSPEQAGAVLLAGVVVTGAGAPVMGWWIGRFPASRVPISVGFCATVILGLTVLFALGNQPPSGFVVPLFLLLALGGPMSVFAFTIARDHNDLRVLGTATGLVNCGGFLATMCVTLGIGWVLGVLGGTTPEHLRWALLVGIGIQAVGLWRLILWDRRVRAGD